MKFRKKPVVIDAIQWNENKVEVMDFVGGDVDHTEFNGKEFLHIKTLEGEMKASPGDWIIKGVKGEFYPCKPDIFAMTYEPAEL
jgi:hypothetical protein